jgi:putative spermidine/putrescine transport system permease protein
MSTGSHGLPALTYASDRQRRGRLLLFIAVAVSLALLVIPQANFVAWSFRRDLGLGMVSDDWTLENYRGVLSDRYYLSSIVLTIYLSALASLTVLLLALPTAYALARLNNWVTTLALSLILTTSLITVVIKILGLQLLLGSTGLFNVFFLKIGLISEPLQLLNNRVGVFIGLVQYTLPIAILLLFGVVQTIPADLEEAAAVHGATRGAIVRSVILPAAMPGLVSAGLVAFNMGMGAFTSAALLGGGRVPMIPLLIQEKIIQTNEYGMGAALSTILLVLVFVINLFVGWIVDRRRRRGRKA